MHKTEAKIGDQVIILRDQWENILLNRNELPIIYGTVVKKYESEDISYHGSLETEIITVAKDEKGDLHYDKYAWIVRPEEFYTMEEFEEKFGRILRDIDDEIKKWNEKKQKITQLFATIKDTGKDTNHERQKT